MARLCCAKTVSYCVAPIHTQKSSRVGGRVHGNLVTRIKDRGEASENLGHRSREHHVPGGQEQSCFAMLVVVHTRICQERHTEV